MRVTVLGSGTSHGVPAIGCDCAVCRSTDPRDRRTRPSILIEIVRPRRRPIAPFAGAVRSILVDTSTDLRMQALANDVRRVDAILFTHSHADHVFGLDDVRRFNQMQKSAIPVLRRRRHGREPAADVRVPLRAADAAGRRPAAAVAVPDRRAVLARRRRDRAGAAVARHAAGARLPDRIVRLPDRLQPHSRTSRGRCSKACARSILDALRHRPHSTHFSVDEAIDVVARLGAERAYFTHICHDLPHAATCARLPAGVELAYDGLVLEIVTINTEDSQARRTMLSSASLRARAARSHGRHSFPGRSAAGALGRIRCSRSATSTACIAATARSSIACAASPSERGATSVVMTFDPHPPRVVRPDKAPPLLMTKAQKLEAIATTPACRARRSCASRRELSRWEPETFVRTVLVDWLRVVGSVGRRQLPVRPRSRRQLLAAARSSARATASRPRRSIRSATRTSSSAARASAGWSARAASTRRARCSATSTSSTARVDARRSARPHDRVSDRQSVHRERAAAAPRRLRDDGDDRRDRAIRR